MENQKTEQENKKITTYDYSQAREEMTQHMEGMTEEQTDKYFKKRAEEFYEIYEWNAEPSETARILTKPSVNCMLSEFQVWLAQKEQYMNYMGCHKAETFGNSKPSELLKEFGQWLVDTADHAEWDYEEWN